MLNSLPLPLVFDHYAGAKAKLGLQQEGLAQVLELVESGRAYVKLSAPYRVSERPGYADLEDLTRLFIRCNPDRMLRGSDWPHPQPGVRPRAEGVCPPFDVDNDYVLKSLARCVRDDAILQKIWVTNPERLYGFGD